MAYFGVQNYVSHFKIKIWNKKGPLFCNRFGGRDEQLNLLTPFDIWRMHLDLKQLIQIACRASGARLAMLAWLEDWREQLLCSKTEVGRSIIVAHIPLHQCSRLLLAEETREESLRGQGDDLHCEDNNDLNL